MMKNLIALFVLGLLLALMIPRAFEAYTASIDREKVSILKQKEDIKKHADWFKSLTTGQQDSVKRLRKSLR